MNTNDLPPAARLACLIEAGRAANPDLKHGQGSPYESVTGAACALGFAALAAGLTRPEIDCSYRLGSKQVHAAYARIGSVLGIHAEGELPQVLARWVWDRVIRPNDNDYSIEEICHSLREGVELARS